MIRISCIQGGILVLGKKNKIMEGIFKEQVERPQLELTLACLKR